MISGPSQNCKYMPGNLWTVFYFYVIRLRAAGLRKVSIQNYVWIDTYFIGTYFFPLINGLFFAGRII